MLIELSRFNSIASFSNSDWTNITSTPLIVQPGGTLSFKSGFLDYNTTSDQVIELQEDVNINIQAGFYLSAPISTDGIVFDDFTTYRPLDLYIPRNTDRSLLTSAKQFTIPAGNYSPFEITEIINSNMVTVNTNLHGSGSDFNNSAETNFFRSTTTNTYTCALEPIPKITEAERDAVLIASDPTQLSVFNVGDYVSFIDFGLTDSETVGNLDAAYTITAINRETGLITTNPPFERIDNYTMANAYMYNYVLFPTQTEDRDINTANQVHFYRQGSKQVPFNGESRWYFDPQDDRKTYMMGASQIQLEYNYNNNGLFQWTYLHTPFYFGTPPEEGVQYYFMGYSFNNIFGYENTQSGIFFTNLEPTSFWEDLLGFNLGSILVKDSPTFNLDAPLRCGVNITGNLIAYDALFAKGTRTLQYADDDGKYQSVQAASSQTTPIVASKTQGVTTSSFFLVELGGLADINMVNDTNLFRTICAIGSKEYNAQGVISLYPDGSSFYTNTSPQPVIISSMRVRILDSLTKQPTNILGDRNSIFLELVNPPPLPPPPPKQSKKAKKNLKKNGEDK
jgi:hypothetical protein